MSVVVVGQEAGLGGRLARGLPGQGMAVELAGAPGDRAAVQAAFAAAAAVESVTAVVHAHVPLAAAQPRPLAEIGDHEWDALVDAPVRALLVTLQAARRHLAAGGRIVVVVPAVALFGRDGLVPLCTVGEAQRVLAKSAARSWGREGLTVNVVAANPAELEGAADGSILGRALPPATAGRGEDVVATVALLLSPLAARLSGATLCADGGDLMAP
jgi:NAD(P)-dependent dehydrogenase (short-subunit alcohol dehydrogenase family)